MKPSARLLALVSGAAAWCAAPAALAFAYYTYDGSSNSLQPSDSGTPVTWGVERTAIGLTTARADLKDAFAASVGQWNGVGAAVSLSEGDAIGSACANGDGVNSAAFEATICGDAWGDTLGVTFVRALRFSDEVQITEADTVFRSFDGEPQNYWAAPDETDLFADDVCFRNDAGGMACDFGRVALHELGHALGLHHPDEAGQHVDAVMNSGRTDTTSPARLTRDDRAGLSFLYPSGSGTNGGDAAAPAPPSGGSGGGGGALHLTLLSLLALALLRRPQCLANTACRRR